ncbi:hypothetical protein FPF71_12010 [Algibacter amylolyticus]|uniref:Uncharacterized protein n=1 Tax=Algibacter amylolyticus TaxID=1608400 RepID=A0A5M7B6W1_9FLAO|nr:hypothetical protein [Algibacter amylolyticus]KAA5823424.1 hypothetical protein F2B50_12010 [Algibacter amylolyticus]MBB5267574.1 hypothetical protein [Algibacter amylolyticus]TSJ73912.1 hypothetical protein FPF71_12010 [Algibacter amylolyticus]
MILNSTRYNKKQKEILNDLVGKPFSFLESLRMNGIGSKRMVIEDVSPNLKVYMNAVSDINYANIELRKQGILIYINQGLKNFTWSIPYYQLVIYRTNGISIHAQGKFIHFKNNKMFKENKQFFTKMLDEKINFDEQHNFLNQ